jgi:hypothetical protein
MSDARDKYHLPVLDVSAHVKLPRASVLVAKMLGWHKSQRLCEAICRYTRASGLHCALDDEMNFICLNEEEKCPQEAFKKGGKHLTGAVLRFEFTTVPTSVAVLEKLVFGSVTHQLERSGWYKIGKQWAHNGHQVLLKGAGRAHCISLEAQCSPLEDDSLLLQLTATCSVYRFATYSKNDAPQAGDIVLPLPELSEVAVTHAHDHAKFALPKGGALQRKNLELGYADNSPKTAKELERWWRDMYGMILPSLSSSKASAKEGSMGLSTVLWVLDSDRAPFAYPNCCLLKNWTEVRRESRLEGGNAAHAFSLLRPELARIGCLSNILPTSLNSRNGSGSTVSGSSMFGGSTECATPNTTASVSSSQTTFMTGSGTSVVTSLLRSPEEELAIENKKQLTVEEERRKKQQEQRKKEEERRALPKKQVIIGKKRSYARVNPLAPAATFTSTSAPAKPIKIRRTSKSMPSSLSIPSSSLSGALERSAEPVVPSNKRRTGSLLQTKGTIQFSIRKSLSSVCTKSSGGSGSGGSSGESSGGRSDGGSGGSIGSTGSSGVGRSSSTKEKASAQPKTSTPKPKPGAKTKAKPSSGSDTNITAKVKAHHASDTLGKLKVPELKDYLRLHKRPLSGKKDVLVLRVSGLIAELAASEAARMPPPPPPAAFLKKVGVAAALAPPAPVSATGIKLAQLATAPGARAPVPPLQKKVAVLPAAASMALPIAPVARETGKPACNQLTRTTTAPDPGDGVGDGDVEDGTSPTGIDSDDEDDFDFFSDSSDED